MISAQNLVYSLQGRRLTDNVSLTFPGGEIVAILGPNCLLYTSPSPRDA